MTQDDPPRSDDPTLAFEVLRAEVTLLRAAISALTARAPAEPPDYTPTLAAMDKSLKTVGATLGRISEHPALRIAPQTYAAEIKAAASEARQGIEADLRGVMETVRRTSDQISEIPSRLRTRHEQRLGLIGAGGIGVAVGIVLWAALAGPIARGLPRGWQMPEKMAAATLHLDRWAAGARLMQSADPVSWQTTLTAAQLWQDNKLVLQTCLKTADKLRRPQTCKVTVGGDGGASGAGASGAG